MIEVIMEVARELGIASQISVTEFADSVEPRVRISYPPRSKQLRVTVDALLDKSRLRAVLIELNQMAKG